MKRIITLFGLFTLLMLPSMTNAQELSNYCVEPKGELLGTIHQLEAQGYILVSVDCQPINYLVAPTPPYVNSKITVVMREVQCPENDLMGAPCILLSTAYITADEIVQNSAGTTIQTNVQTIIAL